MIVKQSNIRFSLDSNLEYSIIKINTDEKTSFPKYNITYNFIFGFSYLL